MTAITKTEYYQTTFDRNACQIGLVHLGFGAFHRAHQAVYVDDYMETAGDLDFGIAAVNLRASEAAAFQKVARQSDGYLLKTTTPKGERKFRQVRSHLDFADWSADAEKAERLLGLKSVHAVTITVTESGYYLNDDGSLNVDDPIIKAEIADGPKHSVYAYLAKALQHRAQHLDQPLSILCCDNIRANGPMLERNFLTYLEHIQSPDLASWAKAHARFPSSMVDRITPRATPKLESEISALFPDHASNAIHAEAFSQWVLEDRFAGPFPDLRKAGVEIVGDVTPYEEAKIRILNGGHVGLAYLGALAGHRTFDAAMRDPALQPHFEGWETEEVFAGLTIDLPFDKTAYLDEIRARFCNEAISDQLERLCMDGYSKMPIYIRPTLEACLKQGITPRYGYDCVASWYVYARRFAAGKMPIAYHEPYWEALKPLLDVGQEGAFAADRQLWGDLPATNAHFKEGIISAIAAIEQKWP